MSKDKIQWTDEQRQAIEARGRDVLVTASAGTGKTAVLSARCADIVSDIDKKPAIWDFLVLTFTDAAAEEMRSRIGKSIKDEYLKSRDPHLREQMILLQGADISTIHSFCKRIITDYFFKLDIDPSFSIIDEDEKRLLQAEVLEQVIDWAWKQENIRQGLELLLEGRDLRVNDGFLKSIIFINDKLSNVVSKEQWFTKAKEIISQSECELAKLQKDIFSEKMRDVLGQLEFARAIVSELGPDEKWIENFNKNHFGPIQEVQQLLKAEKWDGFVKAVAEFDKATSYSPKLEDEEKKLAKGIVDDALKEFLSLRNFAAFNPDYLENFDGKCGLEGKVLLELLKKFDELYSEAKAELNAYDFSDLEHLALKLLTKREGGKLVPSETARQLRDKYKYIFVDEYQDINPVQKEILESVSKGDNMFVVGDVKQSIYAFRGADCNIFMDHLKKASGEEKSGDGSLRVDLRHNFRSKQGVLDTVNEIFSTIMKESVCGLEYGSEAKLVSGNEKSAVDEICAELMILDEEENDEEEIRDSKYFSKRQKEAMMVAEKIKELTGKKDCKALQVEDDGEKRPLEYRDIVVLMRSPGKRANEFVEVFKMAGIPVSSQSSAGDFQQTEIADCMSLLKVLDNPSRDIEFAAVLRSPFFKIDDKNLAKISLEGEKKKSFYQNVQDYVDSGSDGKLAGELEKVLNKIDEWRKRGRGGDLADLIYDIYAETGYISYVSSLPNGMSRKANLEKLHDRAIQFEGFVSGSGVPSLSRFIEFLERILEVGQDWKPEEPEGISENAVRIMSIHQSKGLEFPVVFISEMQSSFNLGDIKDDCLFDEDMTLGLKVIDTELNCKLKSVNHQLIAEKKKKTLLAEEMRILYVALTRAEDRVIMTGRKKAGKCAELVNKAILSGRKAIWDVKKSNNYLDWVLFALAEEEELQRALGTGFEKDSGRKKLLEAEVFDVNDIDEIAGGYKIKDKEVEIDADKERGKKAFAEVKKKLEWKYEAGDSWQIPAKQSVSDITHGGDEFAEYDFSDAFEKQPAVLKKGDSKVSGSLFGTTVHMVMAEVDICSKPDKKKINQKIRDLSDKGSIIDEIAEKIDAGELCKFFKSEAGELLFKDGVKVYREWPFTYGLKVEEWKRLSGGEEVGDIEVRGIENEIIVLQGIIDIVIETEDGVFVIDLKTDNVIGDKVKERAKKYKKQINIYGMAAEAILDKHLRKKWLYFFRPAESIRIC